MIDNDFFQKIYEALNGIIPIKWDRIIYRADYTEGSYSMKFYVKDGTGEYIDCYSLQGVSKAVLIKCFMNLDRLIKMKRKELPEKEKWTVMTIIFDAAGKVNADFDYNSIDESSIDYHEQWKEKYLRG